MKKVITFLICAVVAGVAVAQNFGWGVEAGLNASKPINSSTGVAAGWDAGVRAEYRFNSLNNGSFISSGLAMVGKPFVEMSNFNGLSHGRYSTPTYLQIPLRYGLRWDVAENMKFDVELGVYGAVGLFGKTKFALDSEDVSVSCFDNGYRRFDGGMTCGLGLTFNNKVRVGASADVSFTPAVESLKTYYNRVATLSVGYYF